LARDIALIELKPVDCAGWVIYLLEKMDGKAERRDHAGLFTAKIIFRRDVGARHTIQDGRKDHQPKDFLALLDGKGSPLSNECRQPG
jgi:hypothetical protein